MLLRADKVVQLPGKVGLLAPECSVTLTTEITPESQKSKVLTHLRREGHLSLVQQVANSEISL